ncbi:MAG: SemiSWEET family transporter [Patescibacteria group bacterium]|nr:SemiSWEET family transporter [Patescibacteria group bacterium]
METTLLSNITGFAAAGIGTIMFLPQVIRCYKTKQTKDISFLTYSLLSTASVLWVIYGVTNSAFPIILVNSVILVLSIFLLLLKKKYG